MKTSLKIHMEDHGSPLEINSDNSDKKKVEANSNSIRLVSIRGSRGIGSTGNFDVVEDRQFCGGLKYSDIPI